MASHMKTTVHIADALLAEAQEVARKENTTLKALINEGLHRILAERKTRKPFKLKDCSYPPPDQIKEEWKVRPWEEIRAIIYEGRGE